MKKTTLFLTILLFSVYSFAQIATNFNCNDCDGNNVDLFSKLDSGKVVVICWVMPCSTCIPASKTSYNVVQSFQATYPGRVLFYLVDDYANTSCASLNSWAVSNNIPASAFSLRFSNALIDMTHYGSTGMPKIIVVAGTNHKVLYNANGSVVGSELQAAIYEGLNANAIEELIFTDGILNVFPNPVIDELNLSFKLTLKSEISIEIFDLAGKRLYFSSEEFKAGENQKSINTSCFANGNYFLKLNKKDYSKTIKFKILH